MAHFDSVFAGASGQRRSPWRVLLMIGLAVLVAYSLWSTLFSWPRTDEANYLLQSREIAAGRLPYRDFYEFITPGGQAFAALLIYLMGFSVVGIRLVVLLGWIMEMVLIYRLGKAFLPTGALWGLMGFLWLSFSRYPIHQHHFWSGLTALCAVYFASRYLNAAPLGKPFRKHLALSALFSALTCWITQSIGGLMMGSLLAYSFLQVYLREKESAQLARQSLRFKTWLGSWWSGWGRFWLLPLLAVHGVIIAIFMALGIWDDFWRDSVLWLSQGHYARTTTLGYFSTFHSELEETLKPLMDRVPMPVLLLFLFRIPVGIHLFLIGLLPVLGILGVGYGLPNRFLYRVIKVEDEQLLLMWLGSLAMIVATFSFATSMHIVSNASVAFLLGAIAIWQWLAKKLTWRQMMKPVLSVFYVSLLIAAVIGSWMQLEFGLWLPRFRGMSEALLYTEPPEEVSAYVETVNVLNRAAAAGEPVFIFYESPGLYLAGAYGNATRFTLLIPVYTSEKQVQEVLSDLERRKPLFLVDDQSVRWLGKDPRFRHFPQEQLRFPELNRLIADRYHPFQRFGRYLIYRRNDSPKSEGW